MRSRKLDWLVVVLAPLGFTILLINAPVLYAALYAVAVMVLYIMLAAHRHGVQHRGIAWSTLAEYLVVGLLVTYLYFSVL